MHHAISITETQVLEKCAVKMLWEKHYGKHRKCTKKQGKYYVKHGET